MSTNLMVRRFASHFLLIDADRVIPFGVVALNDDCVTEVFSLNDRPCESANTVFLDGWIAPFFVNPSLLNAQLLGQSLTEAAKKMENPVIVGDSAALFHYEPKADGSVEVSNLSSYFD